MALDNIKEKEQERFAPVDVHELRPRSKEERERLSRELSALYQEVFGPSDNNTPEQVALKLSARTVLGAYVDGDRLAASVSVAKGTMWGWTDYWFISDLAIFPEFQRRGIGPQLLGQIFQLGSKEREHPKYVATVRPDNYASLALFVNAQGFRITRLIRDDLRDDECYLYVEHTPLTNELPLLGEQVRVSSNDVMTIQKLLRAGYVGLRVERDTPKNEIAGNVFLTFQKAKWIPLADAPEI